MCDVRFIRALEVRQKIEEYGPGWPRRWTGKPLETCPFHPFFAEHPASYKKIIATSWRRYHLTARSVHTHGRLATRTFLIETNYIETSLTMHELILVCFARASIRAAGAPNVNSIGEHPMATDEG